MHCLLLHGKFNLCLDITAFNVVIVLMKRVKFIILFFGLVGTTIKIRM